MPYPFYPEPATRYDDGTALLPEFSRERQTDPTGYLPDPGLQDAVNVALLLGQPLLLTGDPGTGKTELARHLSHVLGLGKPLRFDTKSTSTARDLFYTYDAVGHFRAGQSEGATLNYIRWNALGEAILRSRSPKDVVQWMTNDFNASNHTTAKRSVVLIDEVDKAPRDFPNDLLNDVENLDFRVPELGNYPIQASTDKRPILVLTSNSEKNLPDAFLRRCIYYHIEFPEGDNLARIVMSRVGSYDEIKAQMLTEALELFGKLRDANLQKKPSTAELIDWLTALRQMEADFHRALREQEVRLKKTLSTLIKIKEDRAVATAVIENWLGHKLQ